MSRTEVAFALDRRTASTTTRTVVEHRRSTERLDQLDSCVLEPRAPAHATMGPGAR